MGGLDSRQLVLPGEPLSSMGGLAHSVHHNDVNDVLLGPAFFNVKAFGAIGDGTTDDTTAIQNAINAAADDGPGGVVLFPRGSYKITSTLTWKTGAQLIGLSGPSINGSSPPTLNWHGAANGTVMTTETGAQELRFFSVCRRLGFLAFPSGAPNRADICLNFAARIDLGTMVEECTFQGAGLHAIRLNQGGINVHFRDFRIDKIGDYSIKWVTGTSSNDGSFENITWDNNEPVNGTDSKGFFWAQGKSGNSKQFRVSFEDMRLELNDPLTAGSAMFLFELNIENPERVEHFVNMSNVHVQEGLTTIFADKAIWFDPQNDQVSLTLNNCKLRGPIVGVSSFGYGTGEGNGLLSAGGLAFGRRYEHPLTVIHPWTRSDLATTADDEYLAGVELSTDLNVHKRFFHHGKAVSDKVLASVTDTYWDTNPVNVQAGQMFLDPAQLGNASMTIKVCTAFGTLGTLSGVTFSGNTGTSQGTASDVTGLKPGQRVDIGAGLDVKVIRYINYNNGTVYFTTNLANTHSGAAMIFKAPVFKDYFLKDA